MKDEIYFPQDFFEIDVKMAMSCDVSSFSKVKRWARIVEESPSSSSQ